MTFIEKAQAAGDLPSLADTAASVQEAIVDVLVQKTLNAAEDTGAKVIGGGGGVLANRRLRQRLHEEAAQRGLEVYLPSPALATDNGAMIAAAAVHWLEKGAITSWESTVDAGRRLA